MSDKVIGCQLLYDKNIASADSVYFAKSESHIVYPESVLMFRAQNGNWEDDIKSISYVQLLIMNGDSNTYRCSKYRTLSNRLTMYLLCNF